MNKLEKKANNFFIEKIESSNLVHSDSKCHSMYIVHARTVDESHDSVLN